MTSCKEANFVCWSYLPIYALHACDSQIHPISMIETWLHMCLLKSLAAHLHKFAIALHSVQELHNAPPYISWLSHLRSSCHTVVITAPYAYCVICLNLSPKDWACTWQDSKSLSRKVGRLSLSQCAGMDLCTHLSVQYHLMFICWMGNSLQPSLIVCEIMATRNPNSLAKGWHPKLPWGLQECQL